MKIEMGIEMTIEAGIYFTSMCVIVFFILYGIGASKHENIDKPLVFIFPINYILSKSKYKLIRFIGKFGWLIILPYTILAICLVTVFSCFLFIWDFLKWAWSLLASLYSRS